MHTHTHIGSWSMTGSLLVYINCPASVMLMSALDHTLKEASFYYYAVSGFSISNGAVKLTFNSTNHLSSWTELRETHTIHHDHMQYLEELRTRIGDCDGTNIYVFRPNNGRNILTPKVSYIHSPHTHLTTYHNGLHFLLPLPHSY